MGTGWPFGRSRCNAAVARQVMKRSARSRGGDIVPGRHFVKQKSQTAAIAVLKDNEAHLNHQELKRRKKIKN